MTIALFGTTPPRPTDADRTRWTGRTARTMLRRAGHGRLPGYTRAAAHITADPQYVGEWLAPSVESWAAQAGPLVAQNAVTMLQWSGSGTPLIPVVGEGFAVAVQPAQKDELTSRAPTVTAAPDDPVTLGGYVNVAKQVLDYADRSADLIFALVDIGASVGLDLHIADTLDAAAGTGHTDLADALDAFPRDGIYTPTVVAGPPSFVVANAAALDALATGGMRIIIDHRLIRPLVLDPLAAVFVASESMLDVVDEPSVLGTQVGVSRYVASGISAAGVAAIG